MYPNDILSSGRVASLSPLEELWYRRALDHGWMNEGMPADPEEFAGWVGRGCTKEAAEKIISRFYVRRPNNADKVVNNRQEKERKLFRQKTKQKSDAGKKGMQKRWNKKTSDDNAVITPLITKHNISIPISIPISKEETTTTTTRARKPKISDEEWLESLRSTYPLLDVFGEYARAEVWAAANNRHCTRRFFVNWLNRAKPMDVKNGKHSENSKHSEKPTSDFLASIGARPSLPEVS